MDEKKIITAQSDADIWNQINADFANGIPHDYHVEIQHNNKSIQLHIVSSPGGNEEGGYEYTRLRSVLPVRNDFEFVIQPEDFLNRLGKLFGGQDVEIGYPEFDKNVLVKTNNPERLKSLFAEEETRKPFIDLSGYSFGIVTHDEDEHKSLELNFQRLVVGNQLKDVFDAFTKVLNNLGTQL